MNANISYDRVFAEDGSSRILRCALPLDLQNFAPPAPALQVSEALAVSTCRVLRLPVGWRGDWHPTPVKQWLFFLAGAALIEASDGSSTQVSAGDFLLLEDVIGTGHRTSVIGAQDVLIAAVQVDDVG